MAIKKPRFEFYELTECGVLDNWIKSPKEVMETLHFRQLDPDNGATQPSPLRVMDYHSATEFSVTLNQRRSRLYLVVSVKASGEWEQFYQVGSAHYQDDPYQSDFCCGAKVLKDRGYEKIRGHHCASGWTRRKLSRATLWDIEAFYIEVSRYLKLKLPSEPLEFELMPSLGGGIVV